VSFISNKGGVGKSTLAVNAACGLAERCPERVLLVDASLQLGVCASMLDVQPQTTLTDVVRERDRLDETLLRQFATIHESGLHLLAAPRDAVEAAEVDDASLARVLTLARRSYDYVLVDTFPMFDRIVISVLDLSDRAFLVLENVVPTLLGAVKLLDLLDSLGFPQDKERIILNRVARIPGSVKPADVAQRLGRDIHYVVPYHKRIITAANTGRPFVRNSRGWWGPAADVRRLIAEIEQLSGETAHVGNGRLMRNGAAQLASPPT
jgi:pilus assembly protein CpaE